ncbi:MAG TPA: DUF92 domain-containing protein [Candidatus Kryptonia bacterium]
MNEFLNFVLILVVLTLFVVAADLLKGRFKVDGKKTREFVHAAVAVVVFFAPLLFHSKLYPALLAGTFVVVNFVSVRLGMFKGINPDRKNLGTVYYPVSFLILVLLLWDSHPFIVSSAMLIMGLADPAAAIVGSNLRNAHAVGAFGERKTFEGGAAMFIIAAAATLFGLTFFRAQTGAFLTSWALIGVSCSVGIMVAAIELVSPRATDNLTVPLSSAVLLYIAANDPSTLSVFILGEFLALLVAYVSAKLRFLGTDGAVATFILGGFIFGYGEWKWAAPILAFFIIGSLASKLFARQKAGYNLLYEKSHTRDAAQVFANGGFGLLMLIGNCLYPNYHWFLAYVGSLAAVTADTLATEIGVFSKSNPYSLASMRRVEKGMSGAISSLGTFSGFLSAAVLGVISLPLAGGYSVFPVRFIAAGALSGAIGSLADSILGGTLQSQYRCGTCGKITERRTHCNGGETVLVQGYRWINNDVVNFAASVVGAVAMPLFFF